MEKICPVCHKMFEAKGRHHIYCNIHCRKHHHKVIYYDKNRKIPEPLPGNRELRRFHCRKCHELVIVTSIKDKRRRFCSPRCEKLYWKHPHTKRVNRKQKKEQATD